jgi:hypothetical protein
MKMVSIVVSLASVALLVSATGCSKQTESPAAVQTQSAAGDLAKKASDLTATGSAKAQELIDSATKLVGEGKFQDAMAKLKAIGSEKLSVNQKAMVDTLKAQIEKALAATSKAATDAGAASGLIKK